jgi:hypothetical protein
MRRRAFFFSTLCLPLFEASAHAQSKAIGVTVPPAILAGADEVIEWRAAYPQPLHH